MKQTRTITALGAAAAVAGMAVLVSRDARSQDEKPLSEIIKSVEDQQLGPITDVDFERGLWEVEAFKDGRKTTLYFDPKTGRLDRRRERPDSHEDVPPADAKPLSEIIRSVEARNLGQIREVDYDDKGYWEVKVRGTGVKSELHIDAVSGQARAQ
jgi:uncharacterized membrane protein YkoI